VPTPPKPILLTVDDEPQVLNAIDRDLRGHFQGAVRIVKAGGGQEALDAVRRMRERDDPLFLLLVDQRMPGMSGTEFLAEAIRVYPDVKKVLLTAYADTQAAITSINEIGLDHYLQKPWDPPEVNLFPVLDDLLEEWSAEQPPPYEAIRVAGTRWSREAHEVRDFLARNRVPYQWIDIDTDAIYRGKVEALGDVPRPAVFLPDGQVVTGTDRALLAQKIGMRTVAKNKLYDLVVIGAGPAGLAAAVYGASEGLSTVLLDKEATGGQAGTSSRIENYLGFPKGLSGTDLARRATIQAERLGAEILVPQEVVGIRVMTPTKIVTLANGMELQARSVLVATGVAVRRLEVPGAAALSGQGVYYGAALTEAAQYRGEHVFVVGGANSAGQGAVLFAHHASRVTMVVRGSDLGQSMSKYLVDQITRQPNIDRWCQSSIVEVRGDGRLSSVVVEREGVHTEVPAAALFVFIGAAPHSAFLDGLVLRDERGFVVTGTELGPRPPSWPARREPFLYETNVPGIFAAGDVRMGSSRRVAVAVGEGAATVRIVHQYLATI
jgi:thioredoxin reductase (NADPH)